MKMSVLVYDNKKIYKSDLDEKFYMPIVKVNADYIFSRSGNIPITGVGQIIKSNILPDGKPDFLLVEKIENVLNSLTHFLAHGFISIKIIENSLALKTKKYILATEIQVCSIEYSLDKTLLQDINFCNAIMKSNLDMLHYTMKVTDEMIRHILMKGHYCDKYRLREKKELLERIKFIKTKFKL